MKNASVKSIFLLPTLFTILFMSCSTQRPRGYDLQTKVWEEDISLDSATKIYITDTKPIDSIDVNKLIYDIFRIEIDEYPQNLKVYARVYDSLGNFVTNMANPYKKDTSATYFTSVTEQLGKIHIVKQVPISEFNVREYGANDSIPYNIVLSVDYSGSMEAVKEIIFEGTEIFVSLKQSYDRIALTTFNRDYDVKVPLIQDKQNILTLYRAKQNDGFGLFSAVYDAMWNSIKILENAPKEVPRVLVVFSDGDDNYSKQDLSELLDKAKKEKINIFAIAFGYSKDENLRYMANKTGGKFYKAYTKKELISIFRDIYMSLRYYYLITYAPPEYWGYHKVTATLNVPKRSDTLFAYGEYGTADDFLDAPWRKRLMDAFKRPILFDFDSSVVKKESYPIIDEVVDIMKVQPKLKLEIQGHTDNVGTQEYNQALSEARAKNVMELMVARGIESNRLRYRGFGYSNPIASNDTPDGRALNRRTMFVIIAK